MYILQIIQNPYIHSEGHLQRGFNVQAGGIEIVL